MKTLSYIDVATKTESGILSLLSSSRDGLPSAVAKERRGEYGGNELPGMNVTVLEILLRQFRSSFIYLLFVASAVALYLGEYIDAVVILSFLLINTFLGFFQEYRAERALQTLKTIIVRKTRVRRDGRELQIDVAGVVPGDVVLLDAGDMIPADGYFLRADSVTVDESSMTGETVPVTKSAGPLSEFPKDFYGALNIGFSQTTLLSGDAELLVFATGSSSQMGEIAGKIREAESPSAFEEGINHFSKFILKLILATVPLVFLLHAFVQGEHVGVGEFLLFSIALTVSAIPEALPLVTTISLSRGALVLAKKHVVPRRLSAIEDLGSINVLCTDKTGTITENKLSVLDIYGEKEEVLRYALMAPLSAKDAHSLQNSVFDKALVAYTSEGVARSLRHIRRIDELPFDPLRKCGTVLVEDGEKRFFVMRGAPEVVYGASGKKAPKEALLWERAQGEKGCRVLAVAWKEASRSDVARIEEKDEKKMIPVGMIAFTDPLKPSTKKALAHAEKLGVHIKIITGDSREVATWVGKEAGIISSPDEVITGEELHQLSPEARARAVEKYQVFARTMPLQKYEIIEILQKKHLVGFLGEGFNDAPALKIAHVGLAVSGASDIAQDASDIILLNSSLEAIVDGIREGRVIFANSMKYIRATLTSNFGNFYALAFASLFVPYLPMLPIQVLLLNLLSDFPMISIATDTVDDSELKRPVGYKVGELTAVAVVLGVVSTMFDFAFFGYFMHYEEKVLQTMWFIGSILTELVLLFSIRTALPFWRTKRPGKTVVLLTLSASLITVILPYIPAMQHVFGFTAPSFAHLATAFFLVGFYFVSTEIVKLLFYRFWKGKETFGQM